MKTNDDVKFFIQSYFVYEDLKIKTNNYVDDIPFMKLFTKGPYSLNMKFSIEKLIAFTSW